MASPETTARIEEYLNTRRWDSNDQLQAARARLLQLGDLADRGEPNALQQFATLGIPVGQGPTLSPGTAGGGFDLGATLRNAPIVGPGIRGISGLFGGGEEDGGGKEDVPEEPTGAEGPRLKAYTVPDPVTGEMVTRYGFEGTDQYGNPQVSGAFSQDTQQPQGSERYGEFTTHQLPGGRVASGYPILDAQGNQIGFDDIGGSYALPSGAGGPAEDPNASAYLSLAQQRFGFDQSRFAQEFGLEQEKFGQDKLKSQITAARTGKPLEYLSLLRGSPVRYAGTSPVVPTLDQQGGAGGGEGSPELPGALKLVQEGSPVRTTGVPTLRAPGVQAQANMTPFETAANREFGETMGVPSADQESYEELLRRGFRQRPSVTSFS